MGKQSNPKKNILERIQSQIKDLSGDEILEFLYKKASSSDLQSLLLDIYTHRSKQQSPSELLASYIESNYTPTAEFPAEQYIRLTQICHQKLPETFEFCEMSPVAPLGASSVLAPVSQNNVLSSVRKLEVVSDITNVLALEAAKRRKGGQKSLIKLAASHRFIRAQRTAIPGPEKHMRMFALTTAGRNRDNYDFEISAITEHIIFYLAVLTDLKKQFENNNPRLSIQITSLKPQIGQHDIEKRICRTVDTSYQIDKWSILPKPKDDRRYYQSLSFKIFLQREDGKAANIVSGGALNWLSEILSDKKEAFFASGFDMDMYLRLLEIRA